MMKKLIKMAIITVFGEVVNKNVSDENINDNVDNKSVVNVYKMLMMKIY